MLPPDQSPVHILVSKWWSCRQPRYSEINACRAALWSAATREISLNANRNVAYDPLGDRRVLWASQWLDVAHGSGHAIDEALTLIAATHFDGPRPFDRKQLAAGT